MRVQLILYVICSDHDLCEDFVNSCIKPTQLIEPDTECWEQLRKTLIRKYRFAVKFLSLHVINDKYNMLLKLWIVCNMVKDFLRSSPDFTFS